MKIAIEGMDGVGKTSVAKEIARRYNYRYMANPIKNVFDLKEGTEEFKYINNQEIRIYNSDNKILRAWLTGLGNIYSLMQKDDLVLDRSIVSNYYWAGNEQNEKIFKTIIDLVGFPDITVILEASVETRIRRIKNRNVNDKDLKDVNAMKYGYDKILYFVKKYNIPYIIINTDNIKVDEVISKIENKLREYKFLVKDRSL